MYIYILRICINWLYYIISHQKKKSTTYQRYIDHISSTILRYPRFNVSGKKGALPKERINHRPRNRWRAWLPWHREGSWCRPSPWWSWWHSLWHLELGSPNSGILANTVEKYHHIYGLYMVISYIYIENHPEVDRISKCQCSAHLSRFFLGKKNIVYLLQDDYTWRVQDLYAEKSGYNQRNKHHELATRYQLLLDFLGKCAIFQGCSNPCRL